MKNFFANIGKKIAACTKKQKIIAAIVAVAGVSVITVSGVLIYKNVHPESVAQVVNTEMPAVVEATEAEAETETEIRNDNVVVSIPEYKPLGISTDSMEKDLNIYFTDANNKKISGQKFSVKMVSTKQAAGLSDIVAKITDLDAQIKACDKSEETIGTKASASNVKYSDKTGDTKSVEAAGSISETETEETAGGLAADEFATLSEYEQLMLKKIDAIEEYKAAVEKLDGKVLVDDDSDGMIYAKKRWNICGRTQGHGGKRHLPCAGEGRIRKHHRADAPGAGPHRSQGGARVLPGREAGCRDHCRGTRRRHRREQRGELEVPLRKRNDRDEHGVERRGGWCEAPPLPRLHLHLSADGAAADSGERAADERTREDERGLCPCEDLRAEALRVPPPRARPALSLADADEPVRSRRQL